MEGQFSAEEYVTFQINHSWPPVHETRRVGRVVLFNIVAERLQQRVLDI